MRRQAALALLLTALGASNALAADEPVDLLNSGDPSVSEDGTVMVGDPCDSLSVYEPAPDLAYQPGVDAEGNPVAPADLEGSSGSLIGPDHEYTIDLVTPLSDATDTTPGSGAERVADSDIGIGKVTVRDGKVYFNGQPVDDESAHALAEACAKLQAGQSNQ